MLAQLHVHSAFSFLDGCSYPEALAERAASLGYGALALTDHDNLSGAIRHVLACRSVGIKPILGAEVTVDMDGEEPNHLTLVAASAEGYQNLCRLITIGCEHGGRRAPAIPRDELPGHAAGLIALSGCRRGLIPRLILSRRYDEASEAALWHKKVFGDAFYLEMQRLLLPREQILLEALEEIGVRENIPLAATGNAHYLSPSDLPVHDILTCIRTLTRVDEPHPLRPFNAEQYLCPPAAFRRRYSRWPEALRNTWRIAEACDEDIIDLSRPDIPTPAVCRGDQHDFLRRLVYQGAKARYGDKLQRKVVQRLEHELDVIASMRCEGYFLTVWDIVREARHRGIRTSGRGSVVDSAVGHCLGVSDIDPIASDLMFERFMSRERSQMPDIDIDFPRERRDELVRWLQERYGSEHVGGVCAFSTFRARSALRQVGKAMRLPMEEIGLLAKRLRRANADEIAESMRKQPQVVHQAAVAKNYTHLFEMCAKVAGLPRMMSTHLAAVVVTTRPIFAYTPLQPTAKGTIRIAHFDKDDIELVALKTDLLSLPILGAVDQAKDSCVYESIPQDDEAAFEMIRSGEAVGAFELQSPAQRALHAKVRTDSKKDIIDSIALIRPGPGMGGMVENYIRRKLGLEEVAYPHPSLEPALKDTFGVLIFQEQVIEVACAAANLRPGEADLLRKAITKARTRKSFDAIRQTFIPRAVANGLSPQAAEQVYKCILGFQGYGFAEGHARAFGEIAYKSAYLLRHHPAHYLAGLLNNQPMGFYPPNTIISQARSRGVQILSLDINRSAYFAESTDDTIRIGYKQVRRISERLAREIPENAPFTDARDFCRRCRPDVNEFEALIAAGAFDGLHPNRRALLWHAEKILKLARRDAQPRLLDVWDNVEGEESWMNSGMPDFDDAERMGMEYGVMGLNPNCHLISLLRPKFDAMGLYTTADLAWIPGGQKVSVGGLTLCPHTPPTKTGSRVLFFCLEDEFGLIDITCFEDVYFASGYIAFSAPVVVVEGVLQKRGLGRAILAGAVRRVPKLLSVEELKLPEPRINASAR